MAFISGRRFWVKLWRQWIPIDGIDFAVLCSATVIMVIDEFELQLTKTGDKARNWMTMFQNLSIKDEIETSNRTFQSVRDELENYFLKIEWRGDENGRENIYSRKVYRLTWDRFNTSGRLDLASNRVLVEVIIGFVRVRILVIHTPAEMGSIRGQESDTWVKSSF